MPLSLVTISSFSRSPSFLESCSSVTSLDRTDGRSDAGVDGKESSVLRSAGGNLSDGSAQDDNRKAHLRRQWRLLTMCQSAHWRSLFDAVL